MTTAGNAIIQGTGVLYVGACGTLDPRVEVSQGGDDVWRHDITERPVTTGANPPWRLLGKLGKGGLGFSAGFQPQLIEEANSLWAIDARVVQGGGGLSVSLLESTFGNVYEIGLGEAGADLDEDYEFSADTAAVRTYMEVLTFDRHAGPEKSVAGVALLHDGFGASIDGSGERVRRRLWVPRAINTSPFSVAISDNAPQVVVGQFAFALSDYNEQSSTEPIYENPATVADGGQPPAIWMEAKV